MGLSERYTLEVPLGEGEHGTLWAGRTKDASTRVAIAILEDASDDAKARFRKAAEAVVKLVHPSLVRGLEHGDDDDGSPFLVMERLEGDTLATRWEKGPALRVDRTMELAIGLVEALGKLHEAGVAHGDVEPGNIVLVGAPGSEVAKLIGVGLNRSAQRHREAGERASLSGVRPFAYAAPEQVRGDVVASPAGDLYSIAAVAFAGLAGQPPHVRHDGHALADAIARAKPATLATLRKDLTAFSSTLDRALASEPSKRFHDAAAMARALRTALAMGRLVAAKETPLGVREALGAPPPPPVPMGTSPGGHAAPGKTAPGIPAPGVSSPGTSPSAGKTAPGIPAPTGTSPGTKTAPGTHPRPATGSSAGALPSVRPLPVVPRPSSMPPAPLPAPRELEPEDLLADEIDGVPSAEIELLASSDLRLPKAPRVPYDAKPIVPLDREPAKPTGKPRPERESLELSSSELELPAELAAERPSEPVSLDVVKLPADVLESAETDALELPKAELPKAELPKAEPPKIEAKAELPKAELPKIEAKAELPKAELPKPPSKPEAPATPERPAPPRPAPAPVEAQPERVEGLELDLPVRRPASGPPTWLIASLLTAVVMLGGFYLFLRATGHGGHTPPAPPSTPTDVALPPPPVEAPPVEAPVEAAPDAAVAAPVVAAPVVAAPVVAAPVEAPVVSAPVAAPVVSAPRPSTSSSTSPRPPSATSRPTSARPTGSRPATSTSRPSPTSMGRPTVVTDPGF